MGFLLLCAARAAGLGDSSLTMTSDPGDYIGGGQSYSYTLADGSFFGQSSGNYSVNIAFSTPTFSHWWYLDFAAPGGLPLAVGHYTGATRYPFQNSSAPGLSVYGDGRGCNTLTGRFEVKRIRYGPGSTIESFWATFEQHCEGALPALRGEIRYNIPVATRFYTVTPCRVIDTRGPDGPSGGPALAPGTSRSIPLPGVCGIPTSARSVSANLTVTRADSSGELRIGEGGAPVPDIAAIYYAPGLTRAKNAILGLGTAGDVIVYPFLPAGTVHFILDVNGYFQ